MGEKMKLKPGLVYGKELVALFDYCRSVSCALPAVNVVSSNGIVAALEAARQAKSPIIIQLSNGGASFFAGKFLSNEGQAAAVIGAAIAARYAHTLAEAYAVPLVMHTDHAARKLLPWIDGLISLGEENYKKFGQPLFSSHMLDLSEETLEDNLEISATYLKRLAKLSMALEIELGITGGEEDGVDNSDVDASRLYTQPEHVLRAYDTLQPLGIFTVAASFGNTHGVYKPGNVVLTPSILDDSQKLVEKERSTAPKPLNLVFHGGSGSEKHKISEAVSYGAIKFNIDTDTQWAFTKPVREYVDAKREYLLSQIGNPEGDEKPNKKQIDPRVWLHAAEKGVVARLLEAFKDLGSFEKFDLS